MKKIAVTSFAVILILLIGFTYYYHSGKSKALTATLKSQAIPVQIVPVTTQDIPQTINALGSLIAANQVTISPEIAGKIAKVAIQAGQTVTKGDPLFQLDDAIQQAELNSVTANLNLLKVTYQRNQVLAKKGATSLQELDTAKANLLAQEAALSAKSVQVEKMLLRAPFSGKVGAPAVSVGQYVAVGDALITLVDQKHLQVSYSVPENVLAQLKIGQPVSIATSAFLHQTFNGKVIYIAPDIDPATRTISVRAKVDNPNEQLSPGLFVSVKQNLGVAQNALVVPQQAIVADISGPQVYVIRKGHAYLTAVKTGSSDHNRVQIIKGLQAGDHVVSVGQLRLKNGVAVAELATPVKGA